MTAQDQLSNLTRALAQLRGDTLGVAAFSRLAQNQPELLAALPGSLQMWLDKAQLQLDKA